MSAKQSKKGTSIRITLNLITLIGVLRIKELIENIKLILNWTLIALVINLLSLISLNHFLQAIYYLYPAIEYFVALILITTLKNLFNIYRTSGVI